MMTDLIQIAQKRNRVVSDMKQWLNDNPDAKYSLCPLREQYEEVEGELMEAILACGCGDD